LSVRWLDLYTDGRRLDRIIRILEKNLKKAIDDEKIIKYANSITYVSSKKFEIIDRVLSVQELIKTAKKRHEEASNKPYNPSDKYKKENYEGDVESSK